VYDDRNGYLYVINSGSSNLSVINGTTIVGTVSTPGATGSPAVDDSNGYVYIPRNDGNVSVVNGTTLVASVRVGGPASSPQSATYDAVNGYIYVVDEWAGEGSSTGNVSVIDGLRLLASVGVGTQPDPAVCDTANGLVYVANYYNGSVTVINGTAWAGLVVVGPRDPAHGVWDSSQPIAATYDSDNGYVYVTNSFSVNGPNVSVIDGMTLVGSVAVAWMPTPAAYDPMNGYIYVLSYADGFNVVSVIQNLTAIGHVSVGPGPIYPSAFEAVLSAYDAGNGDVYVPNYNSSNVSVISGTSLVGSVQVGDGPGVAAYDAQDDCVYVTDYYSGTVSVIPSGYPVVLRESGLPSGTGWWINVSSGTSLYSDGPRASVVEPSGLYGFSVGVSNKTYCAPVGSFLVNHSAIAVPVLFSRVTFATTFVETGLSLGTAWSVTLNGSQETSSTSTIVASEPNGTYPFVVNPVVGYTRSLASGNVVIRGANVTNSVAFMSVPPTTYLVRFAESGLPSGTSWTVAFCGTQHTSTGSAILFTEPNGTYPFALAPVPGYVGGPSSGTVAVNGANVTQSVAFRAAPPATYVVSFSETGLPPGTTWSVTFNGVPESGKGDLSFSGIGNGTYSFAVGPVAGYGATPSSGSVLVSGSPPLRSIAFRQSAGPGGNGSSTFLGLPSADGYAVLGGVIIAILVVIAAVVLMRRRSRKARPEPTKPAMGGPPVPP
jgi:DNA-binding beta-propeller fold protein YncE